MREQKFLWNNLVNWSQSYNFPIYIYQISHNLSDKYWLCGKQARKLQTRNTKKEYKDIWESIMTHNYVIRAYPKLALVLIQLGEIDQLTQ